MGQLTTHVLDTARGVPAAAMRIRLYRIHDAKPVLLTDVVTNADGRCASPLVDGDAFVAGRYRLVFAAGRYFGRAGYALPEPSFIDEISIEFGIADPTTTYHVPLLVSPWSYATYRGS